MADVAAMEIDEPQPQKLTAAQKGKSKTGAHGSQVLKGGPWVEKYRPTSLADVAAHKDIIDTIDRLTGENRLPHLLLYGPPGTGKTSTILAVARKLYGAQFQNMILELNASDDRGIDVVRQQVQDFASTQSISFGPKVNVKLVILDEADAMTKDAQFALRRKMVFNHLGSVPEVSVSLKVTLSQNLSRLPEELQSFFISFLQEKFYTSERVLPVIGTRIIEKYTKKTRFCLICNYVSKIIPALQSRCTRFRFAPLDAANVTERLRHVIQQESLDVTESGLAAIVRLGNGDMRKGLNILQSAQMASPHLTEEAVYLCTGNPMPKDIEQIAFWLLNESFSTSYQNISEMKTRKGLALVDIVRELQPFVFSINMPAATRVQLINALADIEYRLAFGTNEKLQLGALLSAFTHARIALVEAAQ